MSIFTRMSCRPLVKSRRMSNCLSYSKISNHHSVRGRNWILSPKMVCLPYPRGMQEICLLRKMRFVLDLLCMRKVNLRVRSVLNLQFLNMQLVHMFGIPCPQRDSGTNLHMLRVPHLLKKGGMPHVDRQTMKASGSK